MQLNIYNFYFLNLSWTESNVIKKINKKHIFSYPFYPTFLPSIFVSFVFAILSIMNTIRYGNLCCIISVSFMLYLFSIMSCFITLLFFYLFRLRANINMEKQLHFTCNLELFISGTIISTRSYNFKNMYNH